MVTKKDSGKITFIVVAVVLTKRMHNLVSQGDKGLKGPTGLAGRTGRSVSL